MTTPTVRKLIPEDVIEAAISFKKNGYQGPLYFARKVFDWVVAAPGLLAAHDAELAAAQAEIERLREAAEAVLTNEEHAFSGGMRSYQQGSQTWQVYEDLRAAFTQGETK